MPGTRAAKRQRPAASPPAGGSKKSGGRGGYTELGPGEHELPGGGRILCQPNFVPPAAAAQLFAALKEQIQWQQRPVKVMGRTVMQPRLIAYQADGGELAYTYSGLRLEPERWHPGIASLKREVEAAVGVAFNSCLLNFYRSGADSIGWHSDSEPLYGREPTIATVSLGDPLDAQHTQAGGGRGRAHLAHVAARHAAGAGAVMRAPRRGPSCCGELPCNMHASAASPQQGAAVAGWGRRQVGTGGMGREHAGRSARRRPSPLISGCRQRLPPVYPCPVPPPRPAPALQQPRAPPDGPPLEPPTHSGSRPRPPAATAARPTMRAAALLLALLLSAGSTAWAANYDTLCTTYVVQSGDSLWSISNKFGVLQDDLVAALESCLSGWTSSTALQVGQRICLPGYVPACDYVINSGDVATCKAYQVQQGDTLTLIASVFGIYSGDLVSLNSDVAGSVLQVGTFVRLPPWASTCPDPDSDAASCRVYAVQQGDFVYGVASMFRVTLANLLAVNTGLTTDTVLQAGQRVKIPPFDSTCGNGILSAPPTTGVFDCRAYRVKSGDSLSAIALMFQITVNDLVAVNAELSDPSLLTPGKVIRVPPYSDNCVNGILIDPSNSAAPATPSSSTTDYSAVPAASPSPSPTPSPVVASPSPSPVTASPSPVAASPSPSTAVAPSTGVYVKLSLTGTSATAVAAKASTLASSIATILGVSPASWVSVTAAASRRRLQATASTSTSVTVTVPAASSTSMAVKAQSAASSITSAFTAQGFTVAANSLSVTTYPTVAASPSPSPAPAVASPSPAATPSTTAPGSSTSGSSNVGAIVGGVVGGVGGVCVVAGLTWLVIRMRRQAAESGLYSYPAGVTATVTAGAGLPSVKTGRSARTLREDQGVSSSPRNTVTPRTAQLGQVA